ncbi:MAG: GtrA family protein [Methanomicrobiales archaeon]|nr:GtrA family protein [Methanomicrobiales archaeon]
MQDVTQFQDRHGITEAGKTVDRERFIWFIGIGAVSSLVDIGLLYLLCEWAGIWYLTAAVLSYCTGIVVSYILNKILTFHDKNRHYVRQFTTFCLVAVSCLLLNVGIIWLLVTLVAWHYLAAKVLATICAVFWNYYGQSRITFRAGHE